MIDQYGWLAELLLYLFFMAQLFRLLKHVPSFEITTGHCITNLVNLLHGAFCYEGPILDCLVRISTLWIEWPFSLCLSLIIFVFDIIPFIEQLVLLPQVSWSVDVTILLCMLIVNRIRILQSICDSRLRERSIITASQLILPYLLGQQILCIVAGQPKGFFLILTLNIDITLINYAWPLIHLV